MSPSRIAAGLTVAIGAAVAAWTLRSAAGLPIPVLLTLIGGALLEIGLGVGLLRKSRAAWSFAVAVAGVSAVALLLAMPAILRAGTSLAFALAAVVAIAVQLVLLIAAREVGSW